jgi:hypothetical protein
MTDSDIFISKMPGLCDDCGRSLARDVIANPDRNAFSQYCPHLGVVATAYTGDYQGKPAILTWSLRGPGLSEKQAMDIMTAMVEQVNEMGGDSKLLLGSQRVN